MNRKVLGVSAASIGVLLLAAGPVRPIDQTEPGLGDVVYSVLPPELFVKAHSGTWVLMDGNRLDPGTGLSRFLADQGRMDLLLTDGMVKVPDARGVFLRGMNAGRDTLRGDPDGDRRLGAFQADTFKAHLHDYTYNRHNPDHQRKGSEASNAAHRTEISTPSQTAVTGGKETRPRNIALYTYLKVS